MWLAVRISARAQLRCGDETRTGVHTVADLFCTSCDAILGWTYLKAQDREQAYKEGKPPRLVTSQHQGGLTGTRMYRTVYLGGRQNHQGEQLGCLIDVVGVYQMPTVLKTLVP